MIQTKKFLLPLLILALAGTSLAQSLDGAKFYKLDFVVREVEGGKPVNSRMFSAILQVQTPQREVGTATIRAGGRVPFTSGSGTQFFDLGVNIDAKDLRETQSDVSVTISTDISSIGQDNPGNPPVVRQNRWSSTVMAPIKKPTVVFASDDMTSKRQLQLELTATPIK